MASVTQILRARRRRRAAERSIAGWLGRIVAVLFTLGAALILIAVPLAYSNLVQDLPSLAALPLMLEPPDGLLLHPTQILDRSGEHVLQDVQNPALEERRYLPVAAGDAADAETIAPVMVDATLAVLDPTFWTNPGFTLDGLTTGEAHTLAERLISGLLLADEPPGPRRAIRERILAGQLIQQFGREKVLEWYLNSVYYGNLTYGVDAAAQVYFGKPASELTLPEAALLAAVGEAPALNPFDAPEDALTRQKIVLQAMAAQGYITPEEAVTAAGEELAFRSPAPDPASPYQSFLNLVWEQLAREYDLERIERGGFRIVTSLDYDLQSQAVCTRDVLLAHLKDPLDTAIPEDCPAARLLPTLPVGSRETAVSTAIVILDPAGGEILAMLGDPQRGLDPAHLPGPAPGSMLTPFLYLTAFTQGVGPATLVWDVPVEIPNLTLPPVEAYHGPVRLRLAFANDYLTPALQMMNQVGAENVWRTAQEMGLTKLARTAEQTPPTNCRGCSLLYQGGETTLLALAHAYTPFASQGLLTGQPAGERVPGSLPPLSPVAVLEVSDVHGEPLSRGADTERRPVITQQLAYLVTDVLSDEAARWPSLGHPNALEIGRPAAAKLGGTADRSSVWTIGYTPQILIAIWGGAADGISGGQPLPQVTAALWNALIQYATEEMPPAAWERPPGISVVDVCDPSGQLPTRYCPTVVSEVFLNGNEPTQFDTLYQAYQVNRETGLLATVFTPPELVEERVYMQLPPIAEAWARENNIPTPPESYDMIAMPPVDADAHIAAPQMFANVNGQVEIRGTAAGEGFISYRLQAGQGLNPQGWVQIGEDRDQPVRDGVLGIWDTGDLNGLFAIQMIVLRENNRVDTAITQVTVDNLPPAVDILYPRENQEPLPYTPGRKITFRAEASDNIGLQAVTFYLDGEVLARQSQPPYAVPWYARPGEHTLRVEAVDFAGNTREAEVTFQVEE